MTTFQLPPQTPLNAPPGSTAERIQNIIVDKLDVELSEVTKEASFTNDLGADSLDTAELVMEMEVEFGIAILDEVQSEIRTVVDAINMVEKLLLEVKK